MNAFESSQKESQSSGSKSSGGPSFGRACPGCGSFETDGDGALASKPGLIQTMVFGLYYVLIRGAFSRKAIHCRKCGESSSYKSTGSKVAMAILIILVILIGLAYLEQR